MTHSTMSSRMLLAVLTILGAAAPAGAADRSLDGPWKFAVDPGGTFTSADVASRAAWRNAIVPMGWQTQFADLRDYEGVAWYRREITLEPVAEGLTTLLHFGAVDYKADVYLNGIPVGTHEGGYTSFACDIGTAARVGRNELLVRVVDPPRRGAGIEGVRYREIPHGKQSWYVQTSGIWQSVAVRVVPRRRVERVHIRGSLIGEVTLDARLAGTQPHNGDEHLKMRILDPTGAECARTEVRVDRGADRVRLATRVPSPSLWSPETPVLYTVEVGLGDSPMVTERFGFRTFETVDGRFLLNGRPFYLIAALDQDFYPETGYVMPNEDILRDGMRKAKAMGLNMLRCHIKVPDPRYLAAADELGLLIWYELPNWDELTPEAMRRAEETFDAMLERDANHPSIVIISLINESWGIDLQKPEQRAWLRAAYERAKQKAPGRLIVDNSACSGNFHLRTDINDFHFYWAIPENRGKFDEAVADMARRPSWLFSPFGDGAQTGQEPLVLSEFGNWGLPSLPAPPPWWADRPFGNADVVLPAGWVERSTAHGYNGIFGSADGLIRESQAAQHDALKYEIEQIRLTGELQGYVITEFTDVHWESNGLLDMWRKVKHAGNALPPLQRQDVVIPRPSSFAVWAGEDVRLRLWLSHYSGRAFQATTLRWSTTTGRHGQRTLAALPAGTVREEEPLEIPGHDAATTETVRVDFTWIAGEDTLATNSCSFTVFPGLGAAPAGRARMYDPTGRFTKELGTFVGAAESVTEAVAGATVTMTPVLDEEMIRRLKSGERVLCLADSATVLPPTFPLMLLSRDSAWYDGNWASNLNWVRKDAAPFADLGLGPRLGFESAAMELRHVIGGIRPEDFGDVLAGMFVGWVHRSAAYVVRMKVGAGTLTLCTLPLGTSWRHDPYAASLLRGLVSAAGTPGNEPRLRWNP